MTTAFIYSQMLCYGEERKKRFSHLNPARFKLKLNHKRVTLVRRLQNHI